jgi:hypothetical protein
MLCVQNKFLLLIQSYCLTLVELLLLVCVSIWRSSAMVGKKLVTACSLVVALAAAPTFAFAQSQAAKTGSGTATGVTAGAEKGAAGLSAGAIAGAAVVAAAIGVAIAAAASDSTAVVTTTSTSTATN